MEGRKIKFEKLIILASIILMLGLSGIPMANTAGFSQISTDVNSSANSGGNSGSENIQTGDAKAESSVETNVSGNGKTKVDIKAEATANGKTETREVHQETEGDMKENI